MPAIAINSIEHGQVTIPFTSINVVRRGKDGKAVVVLSNGNELATKDDYKNVSDRMVSVNVWGTINTEQLN